MTFFKYVYTGGSFTEGNGAGERKAHQDLGFVVIDIVLMFFVNFWMCALLRIHVLDGCAVAGALVAQAAALNKTAAACLWQGHHGGQSAQDSGR